MERIEIVASPPDLDSIASVYLVRRALKGKEIQVRYLEHNQIEMTEADYIIDSPHGKARIMRFDHHNEKGNSCSAMKVVEYFGMGEPEKRLAMAVCWQDNAGWKNLEREGMDNLLDNVLRSFIVYGIGINEIEDIFRIIFDAMLKKFDSDIRLLKDLEKRIIYRSSKNNEVLVINGDFPKDIVFQEYKCVFVVKTENGYISVTRSASRDKPDLNDFKGILEREVNNIQRWFFHPIGFYFGYSPYPGVVEDPPINPAKLGQLLYEFSKKGDANSF